MAKTNQKLLTFLEQNPKSTKNEIQDATGLKGLQLYNLLRKLVKDETIVEHPNQTYSIAIIDGTEEQEPVQQTTNSGTVNPKTTTRDSSKYSLKVRNMAKGLS